MRVAGTPEVRQAWFALRGPYMLGYVLLFVMAAFASPTHAEGVLWRIVALIVAGMLIAGAACSYLVVTTPTPKRTWELAGVLEVTGLRALVVFEAAFASWAVFSDNYPMTAALAHYMMAAFALGILLNMTWRRGRHGRG